ncbi:EI24 domain-containing protein [Nannocystaceae bacterium ST9]
MNQPVIAKTFFRGVRAAFEGVRVALADPGVRKAYLRVALGMLALTLVLDVFGIWAVFAAFDPSEVDGWMRVAFVALRVIGSALVLVVGPLLAILTMNIVFPFLGEPVFMAGLRAQDPARADRVAAGPGMPASISAGIALRRLLRYVGLTIAFMLLGLVPVVGSLLGLIGQAWLTARTVSWELMDPYFDRLDIRWEGQRQFVAQHRDGLLGFGLPLGLLLAIPLVGPLLFGWAQGAAGTFLVRLVPPHEREFGR